MIRVSKQLLESSYEFSGHKEVWRLDDPGSGLRGFVALHNQSLGPSIGGTRMFPYSDESAALDDVLRLSRAMTYKCALAGVPYGGGKAVIIGDPEKDKTPGLIEAYAKAIQSLEGKFFTGEDVGISEENVQYMMKFSQFFIGKTDLAGDPSPYAALSAFYSMKAAAKVVFGSDSLNGRRITIKGLGKVGRSLAKLLSEAGAFVIGADTNSSAILLAKKVLPSISIVPSDGIHSLQADVYAPCALGCEFLSTKVNEIKVPIICGAANNQLADQVVGDKLYNNGITYVPDYVANAGGLIDVSDELEAGGYNHDRVMRRIFSLQDTVKHILESSRLEGVPSNRIADKMAEKIFYGV